MSSRLEIVGQSGTCSQGCHTNSVTEGVDREPTDFVGNASLITLGCAKNQVDSELMLGALQKRGFRIVHELDNADLIVINTCGFLQSAVEEGIDRILEAAEYKTKGRCRELLVAGCMVERYKSELVEALTEVDRFVSTDEILRIGEPGDTTEQCFDRARRPYFIYDESMPRIRSGHSSAAYVKIAEGCDRPCSFCIIPKLRGSFRSRSIGSIVSEAQVLIAQGVKELSLVAQDLTAFGRDRQSRRTNISELTQLLGSLDELEGDFWIRLLYAYPIGTDPELINAIASSRHIARYLDIPLQHISQSVLSRMQRPLGQRGTRSLVEMIRNRAPEIALRTTFITGFPGETDQDVELLERFILEGHFCHVGVFCYSQEREALSYSFDEQVDEEVKLERKERLMMAQRQVVERRLVDQIGRREKVLVLGSHSDTDLLLSARAQWQAPETDGEIIINDCEDWLESNDNLGDLIGRFVEVEHQEALDYDLVSKVVG